VTDRTFRAFIAVGLPADVRDALQEEQRRLAEQLQIGWTRPASMHLTLHFLGQIGWDQARRVADAMQSCTQQQPPFRIRCVGLGVFPNERKPRTLWAGIDDPEPLVELQHALRTPLRRCGIRTERRRYRPHLTLARIRRPLERQRLSFLVRTLEDVDREYGAIEVQEVHLFRSDFLPTGVQYTVEATAVLGA